MKASGGVSGIGGIGVWAGSWKGSSGTCLCAGVIEGLEELGASGL